MGLLDALLSNNTDGGGLLASLFQNSALNQQMPVGLPSDTAQYGQPSYAPGQVQSQPLPPIPSVPQQPPAPITAQPQASPQAAPQPAVDQGPSLGDRLLGGLQGLAAPSSGGLVGHLAGAITGLSGQGNLTAKALLAKGVDPSAVQAAINNPELMKTLITQTYGPQTVQSLGNGYVADKNGKITRAYEPDDKFQHITRKDQFGGEEVGTFDPSTGKTTFPSDAAGAGGASGAPAGGVQSMVDNINKKREAGASREDLIKEIPPAYQGYVSSLLDGKAVPANIGRGQARGALMTLAHSIDPTFDETMIPARIQTAKDFTPQGKSGASIVAFNTVQHHIGKLSDDFEKLGDAGQGGFQVINSLRNGIASNTPWDEKRQKAVQAVNDDIKAVTDEMSAAYKAGHVSDTEIKSWNSLVNSDLPLSKARQSISDFVDLLNGKRDALNKVHQQIMGGDAAIIDKEENDMITKKAHDRNAGIISDNPASGGSLAPGQSKTIGTVTIKRIN